MYQPNGLDHIARFNRNHYHLPVRSLVEAKRLISIRFPFMLTVPLTQQWKSAKGGVIPLPLSVSAFSGGNHAITILGFDDERRVLTFANSWGRGWGDEGYGLLPYSYMELYMTEAYADIPNESVNILPNGDYLQINDLCKSPLDNTMLISNVFHVKSGMKLGWVFMAIRDGFLDVEDFFVRPTHQGSSVPLMLSRAVVGARRQTQLPLRLWISHCDSKVGGYNHALMNEIIAGFGLQLTRTRERWASGVAVE